MRNYPEWIIAYWAVVSMGAVVVGLNAWWTPAEMAYGLDDSAPKGKLLVIDGEALGAPGFTRRPAGDAGSRDPR